jgi:hypothetical protein
MTLEALLKELLRWLNELLQLEPWRTDSETWRDWRELRELGWLSCLCTLPKWEGGDVAS